MTMLRIKEVKPLAGHLLRLTLTNGAVVERNVSHFLVGPVFEAIRRDPKIFRQVRAERGTAAWPDGVDPCPDVLIWDGPPPTSSGESDSGSAK